MPGPNDVPQNDRFRDLRPGAWVLRSRGGIGAHLWRLRMHRRLRRACCWIPVGREREIEYIDECPENRTEAFYEGCLTYVDDPERGADVDDDGQPIPRRTFMRRP